MPRRCLLAALTLLTCACGVDAAPAKLVNLSPWLFNHYDGSDEDLAKGVVALAGTVTEVDEDHPIKSEVGRLSAADIASLGLPKRDVSRARPMVLVTLLHCNMTQIRALVTDPDQNNLYADGGTQPYDSYDRKFDTPRADFLAGKSPRLDWTTILSATQLGTTFTENLRGGVRTVPDLGKEASPFGSALYARTFLTKPAVSTDPDKSWDQDYQIEVFFERKPGRVIHLFAAWRHIDFGALTTDDDSMITLMLNNFEKWDAQTHKHCAENKL
jgi:hypothetical protein